MVDKIQLNEAQQAELENSIKRTKDNSIAVKDALKSIIEVSEGQLEGEAAKALAEALEVMQKKLIAAKDGWDIVENNARKVAEAIKEADAKA